MAQQAVVDAVAAQLQSGWTTTAVVLPNQQGEPPSDGGAYIALQFPTARETFVGMAAVGSRTVREDGTFRIVVAVPRGSGVDTGLGYCGTLAALFRFQTFGGVVCYEATSPPTDNNADDLGGYWVLSFSVRYQYDFFA
jgi:uncharacterized protein DUF4128